MTLDLTYEATKLRQRSPIRSRRIMITIIMTVLLTLVIIGIATFAPEVKTQQDTLTMVGIAIAFFVFGSLFAFAFWRQAKILIDTGEVLKAKLVSVVSLPKGMNRVTVEFHLNDQPHSKSFTLQNLNCQAVQELGYLLIVVSPESPKLVEPLYVFAHDANESKNIIEGQSGLLDLQTSS